MYEAIKKRGSQLWRTVAWYLLISATLHLGWEFAHMPLYSIWQFGSVSEILFSGVHCTIGDVMIAGGSLATGVFAFGDNRWPQERWWAVAVVTVVSGLGYTIFSEWYNTTISQAWTYSELMPLLLGTGIGVSPLAQWVFIPVIALATAYWRSQQAVADTKTDPISDVKGTGR